MIKINSVLNKKEKIPWRIIEDEAVIVDINSGNVIQLNEAGSEVWASIDGKRNVKEIVKCICDSFEVDEKKAQSDIIDFSEKLSEKGLINY